MTVCLASAAPTVEWLLEIGFKQILDDGDIKCFSLLSKSEIYSLLIECSEEGWLFSLDFEGLDRTQWSEFRTRGRVLELIKELNQRPTDLELDESQSL